MKLVTKSDIIYAVIITAVALMIFFIVSLFGGSTVTITKNGEIMYQGSINQDNVITVEGEYENIICISDGEVYMRYSSCPNQICVHNGKIHSGSIVCAPNGVVITVEGGDTDAVAQ